MDQRRINVVGGGLYSHGIFKQMIGPENLFSAWREFKRGKIGTLEIQEFALNLENNIFELHQALKNNAYTHSAYTPFYVNDPKLRHIHKASVRDRLLHHAVFRFLYPIFDRHFIHDSYSCRVGKGTHRAVDRLKSFLNKTSRNNDQNVFALKCDVRKFFDSIDQKILMRLIETRVRDERALGIIWTIVGSFAKAPGIGLPLGNVTSQLFANIYLNELDQFVKHRLKAKYYLRYCDDFIILDDTPAKLLDTAGIIDQFLKTTLNLSVHPDKIVIRKYRQGIDFLGYVVLPYHRVLRTRTKRRIFKKSNRRNLPSYLGVLSHANTHNVRKKLLEISR